MPGEILRVLGCDLAPTLPVRGNAPSTMGS